MYYFVFKIAVPSLNTTSKQLTLRTSVSGWDFFKLKKKGGKKAAQVSQVWVRSPRRKFV